MTRKLKRPKTPTDRERITALERQLKTQVDEHRRLRREIDELKDRDPLDDLRSALRQQEQRNRPDSLPKLYRDGLRYDPDDTVN